MKVTALLVCHNGARWLPAVLAGLAEADLGPDRLVVVDTGSTDDSAALVRAAVDRIAEESVVVTAPASAAYGEAVSAGLAAAPPGELAAAPADEWVWLLHDDARPDPGCLEALVAAAEQARPDVAILGPKIREWPSLKRLLEVGVTLSGTGARETGLERGEYDQGQHDQQVDVLAVNTAGMLVRRDVLERLGFDPLLPVFGNDLDFGWRAARAGYACQVVPEAVLFHVEAARRGLRDSARVTHPRREERISALRTLLVNEPVGWLPFRLLRTVIGCLLRAVGLLLVRAPGEAADELLALGSVLVHPGRLLAARRARRGTHAVSHGAVRHLLAPFWLPYRHGLDFASDVGVAVADTAREAAAERRARWAAAHPGDDRPEWLRLVLSPTTVLVLGSVLLALVAGRGLLTGGALHGGALLPAPDGVGHWWQVWSATHQEIGTGSDVAGPAYLLALAIAGTALLGNPGLVVIGLFVACVPLALVGALRFFRRLVPNGPTALWAAAAYALLPVVSGALAQGRLGTVAGAALLPWVARAALGLAVPADDRRGWRSAWRTALALGLLTAFVPVAWLLAVVLAGCWLASPQGRPHGRRIAVVLLLPLGLVLPWLVSSLAAPAAWLVEAGKAGAVPGDPGPWDLLFGQAGGPGTTPQWWWAGIAVAALAALLRKDTRTGVARAWLVAAVAAVLAAVQLRVDLSLPGVPDSFHPWPGFALLVVQAGLVTAAALGAHGVLREVAGGSFSWRQPVAALGVLLAVASPVLVAGWWVVEGTPGPLTRHPTATLPAYLAQLTEDGGTGGVLVVQGGPRRGIGYAVLRSGPLVLGDDAVAAMTPPNDGLQKLVERLLGSAGNARADQLAAYGVRYVYAPAPVSTTVSGGLDASAGFTGASAPFPGTRAWRVEATPSVAALDGDTDGSLAAVGHLRTLLVVLQVLALVAGLVLAAPDRLMDRWRA